MVAAPIGFRSRQVSELSLGPRVDIDPRTGNLVAGVSVPISAARFGPQLALSYSSGGPNSPFGIGWQLAGTRSIELDVSESLPRYDAAARYACGGVALTPAREGRTQIVRDTTDHWIHVFRSTLDGGSTRYERWTHKTTGHVHWRTLASDGSCAIFGRTEDRLSQIHDPEDGTRTFRWLCELEYDRNGNAISYEYACEDGRGVDQTRSYEQTRGRFAQRYLARIRYGNRTAVSPDDPVPADWCFSVVFDHGERAEDELAHFDDVGAWPARVDPFSSYRAGFEIRTQRLCRRILMFHHFPDELRERATLVGALHLEYAEQPTGCTLERIRYSGHRTDDGVVSTAELAPIAFTYTQPAIGAGFEHAPIETQENVPSGLHARTHRWIDLRGDGMPGILSSAGGAWYYKPNLGDGRFGPQTKVLEQPCTPSTVALSDFDGDGNIDLVALDGRRAGYYPYDRDRACWDGFRTFPATPHVAGVGSLQLVDLTGTGRADLVHVTPERIVLWRSKGREGFADPVETTLPRSNGTSRAPLVGPAPGLEYFFADMTGDGLLDQVRIQNGRVEYWPQLGHGVFGAGVVMEDAPIVERYGEVDPKRIRLVDLDGSGTADLLYIGRGELRYWRNAGGNRFVEGGVLRGMPFIDDLDGATVIDFLGDGTQCLVWSNTGTGAIHYLPLIGERARLLTTVVDGVGREHVVRYGHSSRHYLRDANSERPWRTKLPAHRTVVDELEVIDLVGGERMTSRFEYRDGYFDSIERTFRGFGLVDRHDRSASAVASEGSDPICVRTWFHDGVADHETSRRRDFYRGDARAASVGPMQFEGELTSDEHVRAWRALAGQQVRTESYAIDRSGSRAPHPFQVSEARFSVRLVQPAQDGERPCLVVLPLEELSYTYEQEPADPRIAHAFTVAIDDHGHATRIAKIAYPRRATATAETDAQHALRIEVAETSFVHREDARRRLLGLPLETRRFEVTGLQPSPRTGADAIFTLADLDLAAAGVVMRMVQWERLVYWNDARDEAAVWPEIGRDALAHHKETACFEESTDADAAALGYHLADGYWWQASATVHFLPFEQFHQISHELLPVHEGVPTRYEYDPHGLFVRTITDVLGNRVTAAQFDYQWLAPVRIVDANDNVSEARYDALGIMIAGTEHGAIRDALGAEIVYGNAPLASYVVQPATFDDVLRDPARYLQGASTFLFYELSRPIRTIALSREDFVHPYSSRTPSASVVIQVAYVDGFGRTLQLRERIEPGPVDFIRDEHGALLRPDPRPHASERWRVSGHRVFDASQRVVRAYEPFFSATHELETDAELRAHGITTITHYDALGRPRETRYPDDTTSRFEYAVWERRCFDRNDAIIGTAYESARELLPASDPERIALESARAHAGTASRTIVDVAGRDVVTIEDGGSDGQRRIELVLDFDGNLRAIGDTRLPESHVFERDMLGRVVREWSADAGELRRRFDAAGRLTSLWSARGVERRYEYDRGGRVRAVRVVEGATVRVAEQLEYGEDLPRAEAVLRNARGRVIRHRDQAGVATVETYDRGGAVLHRELQLASDHRREPDWTAPDAVALDAPFVTRVELDGRGRVREQHLPDATRRRFEYQPGGGGVANVTVSSEDGLLVDRVFLHEAEYDAYGQRTRAVLGAPSLRGSLTQTTTFDPRSLRLRTRETRATTGTHVYQQLQYTFDPAGNVVHVSDAGSHGQGVPAGVPSVNVYTYDPLYRLVAATGRVHRALEEHPQPEMVRGAWRADLEDLGQVRRYQQTYRYDISGSLRELTHTTFGIGDEGPHGWTTHAWVSDRSHRSLPADLAEPEDRFDAAGNCFRLPHLRAMEWNDREHLARVVVVPRDDGRDDAEYYVYGADRMRVRRVTERLRHDRIEIEEKIYLDGCELKRIRGETTPVLERWTSHITDGTQLIARVHRWTHDRRGLETRDLRTARIHYVLTNHLGSTTLEIDGNGDTISYEEYFPYGGTAFLASRNHVDVALRDYRYSGKERDDVTGFYYYGHRYYAPGHARWLSPDPLGPADGPNLYVFSRNNPTTFRDPDGLLPEVLVPASQLPLHVNPGARWEWVDNPTLRAAAARGEAEIPESFGAHTMREEAQFEDRLRTLENEPGWVLYVYDPEASWRLQRALETDGAPDIETAPPGASNGEGMIPYNAGSESTQGDYNEEQFAAAMEAFIEDCEPDLLVGTSESGEGITGGEEQGGDASVGNARGNNAVGRGERGEQASDDLGGGAGGNRGNGAPSGGGGGRGDGNGGLRRTEGGRGRGANGTGRGGGGSGANVGIGSQGHGRGVGASGRGTGPAGGRGGRGARGRAGATGQRSGGGGSGGAANATPQASGSGGNGAEGGVPIGTSTTAPPAPNATSLAGDGARWGLEGSTGRGGLARGDNSTGSRHGRSEGVAQGSLLSGGEGGTEAADLGDHIVNAMAIATGDFIGYDPLNPNRRESGVPGGELGWIDWGETANQAFYVVGSVLMAVLPGATPKPPPIPRPRGRILGALRDLGAGALRRLDEFIEPVRRRLGDILDPATARLQRADASIPVLDMRWGATDFVLDPEAHIREYVEVYNREMMHQLPAFRTPAFAGSVVPGAPGQAPTIVIRPTSPIGNPPPALRAAGAEQRGGTHRAAYEALQARFAGTTHELPPFESLGRDSARRPMGATLFLDEPRRFGIEDRSGSVNGALWGTEDAPFLPEAQRAAVTEALRARFAEMGFTVGWR